MIATSSLADDDDRAEPVAHPNVIVILTDDQGTADLHIAGASDIETPHLDELARTGVRFTQFYAAAPLCQLIEVRSLDELARTGVRFTQFYAAAQNWVNRTPVRA